MSYNMSLRFSGSVTNDVYCFYGCWEGAFSLYLSLPAYSDQVFIFLSHLKPLPFLGARS